LGDGSRGAERTNKKHRSTMPAKDTGWKPMLH
jgi:hypothetical protein